MREAGAFVDENALGVRSAMADSADHPLKQILRGRSRAEIPEISCNSAHAAAPPPETEISHPCS